MTKEEIFNKIDDWEFNEEESFNDYFTSCAIDKDKEDWAEFLTTKGFVEHAQNILSKMISDGGYVDQDDLFDIKPIWLDDMTPKESEDNWDYNMNILSEYISTNKEVYNKFFKFITEKHCVWHWSDKENNWILVNVGE